MATQIGQMDLIYANAQVTIIAAAGEGPHHGLLGVAGTLRTVQPALRLGKHHIASTLAKGTAIAGQSKWAWRGWTYQKAILSKRHLIFTDQQVFWECNNMYCAEVIRIHPDLDHSITSAIVDNIHNRIFRQITPGTDPGTVFSYISEFSKRSLTYERDAIKALSGIFRTFERSENPLYQLKGIPIFFPVRFTRDGDHNPVRSKAMSKSTNQGFLIGLTWFGMVFYPQKRVPVFSSWSWAGWTGEVDRMPTLFRGHDRNCDDGFVWLETDGGKLLALPAHEDLLQGFMSQIPPNLNFIHIEARTFTCSYSFDQSPNSFWEDIKLCLQISENPLLVLKVQFYGRRPGLDDYRTLSPWKDPLTVIVIGDRSGNSLHVAGLAVQELNGYYERVYCFSFEFNL
jgi:hypothetical protein